jgi:hypothetical protein
MRNIISFACAVAVSATVALPVLAYDHDHDHDHDHYNNGHHNGWNNRYNRYNKYNRYKKWNRHQQHVAQRVAHDWNWEKNQYYTNWNRVNVAKQRELDAQLRAQWLAYHHNNWNGAYSWSNYRDPNFINYLHTSNPSLLTQIRTIIGF